MSIKLDEWSVYYEEDHLRVSRGPAETIARLEPSRLEEATRISALPELLRLAEAVLNGCDYHSHHPEWCSNLLHIEARAALVKARGE